MTEERQKDSREGKGAKPRADKKRIKAEFNSLKKALGDGEVSGLVVKATEEDVQNLLDSVEGRMYDEVDSLWGQLSPVEETARTAAEKADKAEKDVGALSKRVSQFEDSSSAKEETLAQLSETLTQMKTSTEELEKKAEELSDALTLDFQTREGGKKTMRLKELTRHLAETGNNASKGVGSVRREINDIKADVDELKKQVSEHIETVEGVLTRFMEALQEKGILPKPEGD